VWRRETGRRKCQPVERKRFCCRPALSTKAGFKLPAAQVVRGSVGLGFVILLVHRFAALLTAQVSGQSRPSGAAPFENETSVTSAVIVATANDGAVTAKERSRSPIGTCRKRGCDRSPSVWSVVSGTGIPGPLLRSHGSVIGDSWMISYQMKFQLSPAPAGSFRRKLPRRSCQVRPPIRGRTLKGTALTSGDSS